MNYPCRIRRSFWADAIPGLPRRDWYEARVVSSWRSETKRSWEMQTPPNGDPCVTIDVEGHRVHLACAVFDDLRRWKVLEEGLL